MEDVIFAALGVSLSAICIWLAVRVITRRERWAIWTAVLLTHVIGLMGSAYCVIFYGWLTATPLSPAERPMIERFAYVSMFGFVLFACAALVAFIIFIRSTIRK